MANYPVERSIDELVDLLNQDIGRAVACPCCGRTNWKTVTPNPFAVPLTDARERRSTGFFALGLFCGRCGYVRFHVVHPDQALGNQEPP